MVFQNVVHVLFAVFLFHHGKNAHWAAQIGQFFLDALPYDKFAVADIVFQAGDRRCRLVHHRALVVVAVGVGQRHLLPVVALRDGLHLVEHRVGDALLLGREGVAFNRCAAHGVRAQLPVGTYVVVLRRGEHLLPVRLLVGHAPERVVGHVASRHAVQTDVRQAVQVVVCEGLFQVAQVVCSGG